MTSDHYGSARWAADKDLREEGIAKIPAAQVAQGGVGNHSFLLGCAADAAELTKAVRQGYSEVMGAISEGAENLVRKVAGKNIKILVMDTEVYSNTGGQASKSTPTV